jgi:hypothetical protein
MDDKSHEFFLPKARRMKLTELFICGLEKQCPLHRTHKLHVTLGDRQVEPAEWLGIYASWDVGTEYYVRILEELQEWSLSCLVITNGN